MAYRAFSLSLNSVASTVLWSEEIPMKTVDLCFLCTALSSQCPPSKVHCDTVRNIENILNSTGYIPWFCETFHLDSKVKNTIQTARCLVWGIIKK